MHATLEFELVRISNIQAILVFAASSFHQKKRIAIVRELAVDILITIVQLRIASAFCFQLFVCLT
jgi:hypothetical protein